jgi:hypothetical protein
VVGEQRLEWLTGAHPDLKLGHPHSSSALLVVGRFRAFSSVIGRRAKGGAATKSDRAIVVVGCSLLQWT